MNSESSGTKRVRPYWHVDAKWVFSIMLFLAFALAVASFALSRATERQFAVTSSAAVIAGFFSKNGLDDAAGLEEFRQKVASTPAGSISPIPQFPGITISKTDALNLEPRDLRIKIFSQISGPIYDKGLKGAAAGFTANPDERATFERQATLLGFATRTTHQNILRFFWISAIISLLLAVAVVYFSAGWGRLVSLAMPCLIIGLPGSVVGLMLANPPKNGNPPTAGVPDVITQGLGSILSQSYFTVFLTGAGLLLVALVGKLVQSVRTKKSKS